jgi:hypothetical protein
MFAVSSCTVSEHYFATASGSASETNTDSFALGSILLPPAETLNLRTLESNAGA